MDDDFTQAYKPMDCILLRVDELASDFSQVVCVSLHPGTVNTDLSRPYHKNVPKENLFSTERSVNCLMSIIETLNIEKTGKAYNWDGTELLW